jgi:hypothetical protein
MIYWFLILNTVALLVVFAVDTAQKRREHFNQ